MMLMMMDLLHPTEGFVVVVSPVLVPLVNSAPTANSISTIISHKKRRRTISELQLMAIDNGGVDAITGVTAAAATAVVGWWWWWFRGTEQERMANAKYEQWEALDTARREERARLAYMAPRDEPWSEEELRAHDGTRNPDGPILVGVAGKVYNVWKGRHFYGPGGEYSIFAGRDATRLLAKFRTQEEDDESLAKPLTMGERATLEGYIWTFKEKYDVVGTLAGYDPNDTAMW